MKTKFAKDLSSNIKDDIKDLKHYGHTYDEVMNWDSGEEFIVGSLMAQKILVNTQLQYLIDDIQRYGDKLRRETTREFSKLIEERTNVDDWGYKNGKDMLKYFEAISTEENVCWEQGYVRGLEAAINSIVSILSEDQKILLSKVNY